MKKSFWVLDIAIILFVSLNVLMFRKTSTFGGTLFGKGEPVDFADKNLEAMVRAIIKNETGVIYKKDLEGITELYIFGMSPNRIVDSGYVAGDLEEEDLIFEYTDTFGKFETDD